MIDLYLKENKIDTSKIDLLDKYTDFKQTEIENERSEIVYPSLEEYLKLYKN